MDLRNGWALMNHSYAKDDISRSENLAFRI
jgi:hypothetical protein